MLFASRHSLSFRLGGSLALPFYSVPRPAPHFVIASLSVSAIGQSTEPLRRSKVAVVADGSQ